MTTSSEELQLHTGMTLCGKWRNQSYTIIRTLGAGANGKVFYVKRAGSHYALKVGLDPVDLLSEVNALRTLSRASASFRGLLLDVDDFVYRGKEYPFFVMKYIDGTTMVRFFEKQGEEWFYLIGLNLLKKLCELHTRGFVFGDLKMENVMVSAYGQVELIDFGGVTLMGRSVKQFTELYDRGFWGAGSREADEQYDLFSFAVLMSLSMDRKGVLNDAAKGLPQTRSVQDLVRYVQENEKLAEAAPFLQLALSGGFPSSREAYESWRKLLQKTGKLPNKPVRTGWLSVCFTLSLILFAITVYYYWL